MSDRLRKDFASGPAGTSAPFSPFDPHGAHGTTTIADNLVHEITNPVGVGCELGYQYVVQVIGEDAEIMVLENDLAPAVGTVRADGICIFHKDSWTFSPNVNHNKYWAVKRVDGGANAVVIFRAMDHGH